MNHSDIGDFMAFLSGVGGYLAVGIGLVCLVIFGWPKPDPEGDAAEDLGRVPGGDEQ
jgi:hypothetical protein